MTVTDLIARLKTVKVQSTEILFRDSDRKSYDLAAVFYGVKADGNVAYPQVGEEPNCVILQIVAEEAPATQA
jgi:hypothetical protein